MLQPAQNVTCDSTFLRFDKASASDVECLKKGLEFKTIISDCLHKFSPGDLIYFFGR